MTRARLSLDFCGDDYADADEQENQISDISADMNVVIKYLLQSSSVQSGEAE